MNYETDVTKKAVEGSDNESLPPSPVKIDKRMKSQRAGSGEDTDFHVSTEDEESEGQESGTEDVNAEMTNLGDATTPQRRASTAGHKSLSKQHSAGAFIVPSFRSTPKSTPKKNAPKHRSHSSFPSLTLSPSSPKLVKGKTGARRISKPKSPHEKYGQVMVTKEPPPHRETGDLTQGKSGNRKSNTAVGAKAFQRAQLPVRSHANDYGQYSLVKCPACHQQHPQGACALKLAGVEHCGLCGLAHYGIGRTCPHIKSETQVREMLIALRSSPEKKELVDMAVKYLRGVKGHLVQMKKKEKEKVAEANMGTAGGMPHSVVYPTNPPPPQGGLYVAGQGPPQQYAQPGFHPTQGVHAQPSWPRPAPGGVVNQIPNQQAQRGPATPVNASTNGSQQGGWMQPADATQMDDHHVESALRGFLGRPA